MKSVHKLLAVAILGAFLFAATPVAGQDLAPGIYNPEKTPTPTKMYFHVNGIQDFPINTQLPDDRYQQSEGLGVVTHSQGCVEVPMLGLVSNTHHTYYGYSSPGYVQYDVDEGGKPRYHPERGISFDVNLDSSQDIVIEWFMESQLFGGDAQPNPNNAPAVIPQVVVRATVREGDQISVSHAEMNTGQIIAQGFTTPTDLAGQMTQPPPDGSVEVVGGGNGGEPAVYKFTVNAPVQKNTINKDEAYNVRIDVFQKLYDGCADPQADQYTMADWLRVHTSPNSRPNMVWHVMNPLRIEFLHPQFIGDDLVVHTSTNSPWGNYDVRGDQASESQGGLEVKIEGPSVPVTFNQVALTARTHEHDHHTEAVDATWVWEYKKDGAKNGLYTVTFKAKNDQETTEAIAVAQFEIGSGKVVGCGGQAKGGGQDDCFDDVQNDGGAGTVEESPGIGFVALVGILAAAGFALKRRRD